MGRAHIFRPLLDGRGNLLPAAQVTVLGGDFQSPIAQPLYAAIDGTETLNNPVQVADGLFSVWLDSPARVNLRVEAAGFDTIHLYVDALPPAPEVIQTREPLRITNAAASGKVLVGTATPGEAQWVTYDPNAAWSEVPGATENAYVGGATTTVGFFGSSGTTRPVIAADAGGNPTLAALLEYLDDLGLISWTGTLGV